MKAFKISLFKTLLASAVIIGGSTIAVAATSCGGDNTPPLETGVELQSYDSPMFYIGDTEPIVLSVKLWNFDADPLAFQWDQAGEDIFNFSYSQSYTDEYDDGNYYFECFLSNTWNVEQSVAISCMVDDNSSNTLTIDIVVNPNPLLELTIDASNLSTYFNGSVSSLGTAKPELGTYLASTTGQFINKINFNGITGIQGTKIFGTNSYIAAQTGQIKTLNFANSDISSIGTQSFYQLWAIEEFYITCNDANGLTVNDAAFFSCKYLETFSLNGTLLASKPNAFHTCTYLHDIHATEFMYLGFNACYSDAYKFAGTSGTSFDAYGIHAAEWVNKCKNSSAMGGGWVGHNPVETGVELQSYDSPMFYIGDTEPIVLSVKLWNFDANPNTFQWDQGGDMFNFSYSQSYTDEYDDGKYYFECYLNTAWTTEQSIAISCTVGNNSSNTLTIDIVNDPSPALELTINATNLSTYFNGTIDNLGTAKPELGTYLASEEGQFINTLNFSGITGIQAGEVFGNNAYVRALNGQIKILNFADSDISLINNSNFTGLYAINEFYITCTSADGLTIDTSAFQNTKYLETFSLNGTLSVLQANGFRMCSRLHEIHATEFKYLGGACGEDAFKYASSSGACYGINAQAWVAQCKVSSTMASGWVGHNPT